MSTVAVNPGRKGEEFEAVLFNNAIYDFGSILTFTVKLGTWSAVVPTTLAALPISVTTPVNNLDWNASTWILEESPIVMRLMSFSFTSTFTSSWFKSDMVI